MPAPRHIFHVMSRTLFFLAAPDQGAGLGRPLSMRMDSHASWNVKRPVSDHYIGIAAAHMPDVH